MGFVFNADEVLEMAEQIERNGAGFYREAARRFPAQQRLFLLLAEQEDQHQETFAALRRRLNGSARGETAFDPDGQAQAYLRAMADGRVVDVRRRPADLLTGRETIADVLNLALGMEKDSIVFYLGLKDSVPPALGRDAIDLIIREEQKHIVFLNSLFPAPRAAP